MDFRAVFLFFLAPDFFAAFFVDFVAVFFAGDFFLCCLFRSLGSLRNRLRRLLNPSRYTLADRLLCLLSDCLRREDCASLRHYSNAFVYIACRKRWIARPV